MARKLDETKKQSWVIPASIREMSDVDALLPIASAALEKAGHKTAAEPMVGENGKPRMLQLTAWIAHAGKPNRNGQAFLEEDLNAAVEKGLFSAPYFGMIDFNHDFSAYGVWHRAKYAYDPVAEEFGILAEGALFAWRYKDLADKLLATMQRHGHIDVSMAAIPEDIEFREYEDGSGRRYEVLRKPVFFTTSVLDVKPADPNARGQASENPEDTSQGREDKLTRAFEVPPSSNVWQEVDVLQLWESDLASILVEDNRDEKEEEDSMNLEQLLAAVKAAVGEGNDELRDDLRDVFDRASRLSEVEASLAAAEEAVESLTEAREGLEGDLETTRLAMEEAQSALSEMTEELEELRKFKADVEEEIAAEAAAELREDRLESLTESARARLEAKDEEVREKIIARLVEADEDEFEALVDMLNTATRKDERESYEERARREGTLAGVAGEGEGAYAIDKYTK